MQEQNQRHKGFYESLNGKTVVLTLQNGDTLTGRLSSDNYNVYDVLLDAKDQSYLIPKASVMKVMFSGGVK
jgi:small nuclear ribonucleoprotein (snRNP)-like protein